MASSHTLPDQQTIQRMASRYPEIDIPSVEAPRLISTLNLPFRRRGRAILADGSESLFDIYETRVIWDGQPRRVAIDAVETEPLVGMAMLFGYELTVQAVVGGRVSIKPIP